MADDVLLNKASTMERCVARAREEYLRDPATKRMVGFRNIAVHDYQALQLPITVSIITDHLDEFLTYSKVLLSRDAQL